MCNTCDIAGAFRYERKSSGRRNDDKSQPPQLVEIHPDVDDRANGDEAEYLATDRGNDAVQDRRDDIAEMLWYSDSSNDDIQPPPRSRRRLDLNRENYELYNEFCKTYTTKKNL